MDNYYQYTMGLSNRILIKRGVLPSKFSCQEDRSKRLSDTSRPVLVKWQRTQLIQELLDWQRQEVLSEAGPSNILPDPMDVLEVDLMTAGMFLTKDKNKLLRGNFVNYLC